MKFIEVTNVDNAVKFFRAKDIKWLRFSAPSPSTGNHIMSIGWRDNSEASVETISAFQLSFIKAKLFRLENEQLGTNS